jgi:hypothetical protein
MDKIDCLSHEIWPALEKGWPKTSLDQHFFWGLGGDNVSKIEQLEKHGQEWYYVDVGYLTQPITRYPIPKIHDYDKTYFRIVKGKIHTLEGSKKGGDVRLKELAKKGLPSKFENWKGGEGDHILICPSSETVTYKHNNLTQGDWVDRAISQIKKLTNRDIRIRYKPRPNNEWWGKDIKEDLDDCHCLITNMSLSAIDSILEGVPVVCDGRNVAWPVSTRFIQFINDPLKPTKDNVNEWMKLLANNQFTIEEMKNGTAYKVLSKQPNKVFTI